MFVWVRSDILTYIIQFSGKKSPIYGYVYIVYGHHIHLLHMDRPFCKKNANFVSEGFRANQNKEFDIQYSKIA